MFELYRLKHRMRMKRDFREVGEALERHIVKCMFVVWRT